MPGRPENLKPFAKGADPRRYKGPVRKRLPSLADLAREQIPEIFKQFMVIATDPKVEPKVRVQALNSLSELAGGKREVQGEKAAALAADGAPAAGMDAATAAKLLEAPPDPSPEPPTGTLLPFPPPKEPQTP